MTTLHDLIRIFDFDTDAKLKVDSMYQGFDKWLEQKHIDNLPIQSFFRVCVLDSDSIEVEELSIIGKNNKTKLFKRSALPEWLGDCLAVLEICESGDRIEGIGSKYSQTVYFIEDKKYEIR